MINTKTLKKLWWLLDQREKHNAWLLMGITIISALSSVLMVGAIMPFLYVLSNLSTLHTIPVIQNLYAYLDNNTQTTTIVLAAITITVIILANVITALRLYLTSRYIHRRAHAFSQKIFLKQLAQPYEYMLVTSPALYIRRAITDPTEVASNYMMPLADLISSTITTLALLVFLYWVNPAIMLMATTFFVFAFSILFLTMKGRLHTLAKNRIEAFTLRSQIVQETMRCFPDIKMSGTETYYSQDFAESSYTTHHTQGMGQFLGRVPRYLMQTLFFGGLVLAATLLSLYLDTSAYNLKDLIPTLGAFAFGGQRLIPELQAIYNAKSQMAFGKPSVEHLWDTWNLLNNDNTKEETRHTVPMMHHDLTVKNLTYSYPHAPTPILNDITLHINKGDHIGLVGESGSGKSTLISLIMGLLQAPNDTILLNGNPLQNEQRADWRQKIAYVPQDVRIFHETLRTNLTLGNNANDETIMTILDQTGLSGWFESLPKGLDTLLHGATAQLSGGQKQRLGIARALLKNADLYILDEATSALDNETEAHIQHLLKEALKGKTSITIAHRLHTLQHCTRIVKLDKGTVVSDTYVNTPKT